MPPREQWNHEIRELYRTLIRLRREAGAWNTLPELLWVDDESRSAAWRIGPIELLVNCGSSDRSVSLNGVKPIMGTSTDVARSSLLSGEFTLPSWSAAIVRHPGG